MDPGGVRSALRAVEAGCEEVATHEQRVRSAQGKAERAARGAAAAARRGRWRVAVHIVSNNESSLPHAALASLVARTPGASLHWHCNAPPLLSVPAWSKGRPGRDRAHQASRFT